MENNTVIHANELMEAINTLEIERRCWVNAGSLNDRRRHVEGFVSDTNIEALEPKILQFSPKPGETFIESPLFKALKLRGSSVEKYGTVSVDGTDFSRSSVPLDLGAIPFDALKALAIKSIDEASTELKAEFAKL